MKIDALPAALASLIEKAETRPADHGDKYKNKDKDKVEGNTARDGETSTAGGDDLRTRLRGAGLRSPATANAFERFARLVLPALEGEARAEVERQIVEVAEQLGELADERQPYGKSLEHQVKKLLNDPSIRKALKNAAPAEEPVHAAPVEDPTPVEPPETLTETAPAGGTRLNLSI